MASKKLSLSGPVKRIRTLGLMRPSLVLTQNSKLVEETVKSKPGRS